jgi:hypothetical protein
MKSSKQQGSILVTIMVVMVLVMGLASALIEHFAVTEARAIEESLAKIRVHWGMSGMVDYALSRARATGTAIYATDGTDADGLLTKISQINDFFDELNGDTADNDNLHRFTYNTSYMLDFTGTTNIHSNNSAVKNNGQLFFTINLAPTPTPSVPSITGLDSRINDLTVDFCIASTGATLVAPCTVVATNQGDSNIFKYSRF